MNIEFHTPAGDTQEWLVDHIKRKLVGLRHRFDQISRAKVFLKKRPEGLKGEYACEIDLQIYGSSMAVENQAASYAHAADQVIHELERQVEAQVRKLKDPPDQMYTSVRV